MQKQKTIAKWLAVILLLTAVVASYVIASSVIKAKNEKTPFAGAIDESGGSHQQPEPAPEPIYSELPRSAEKIDGAVVAHLGGEGKDVPLARVDFYGKTFVFFESGSKEYDVKSEGIYIAVFEDSALAQTVKIAESAEKFLAATLTKNGIAVITANAKSTSLRLFDASLKILAESAIDIPLTCVKTYTANSALSLFATDGSFLYFFNVSTSLDAAKSNFVYPIDNARIDKVIKYPAGYLLFCTSSESSFVFSFSADRGFLLKQEYKGCELLQALPTVSDGESVIALLLKSAQKIEVKSVNTSGVQLASFEADGEMNGVLFKEANNLILLCGKNKYSLCSHLELQSETAVSIGSEITEFFPIDTSLSDAEFIPINGSSDRFIISFYGMFCLAKLSENKIDGLFLAKGEYADALVFSDGSFSLLFSAKNVNGFSYMCFGDTDVFLVTGKNVKESE